MMRINITGLLSGLALFCSITPVAVTEGDRSARGPRPGIPVIMPAGMLGDRATVIFFRPEEIGSTVKRACH